MAAYAWALQDRLYLIRWKRKYSRYISLFSTLSLKVWGTLTRLNEFSGDPLGLPAPCVAIVCMVLVSTCLVHSAHEFLSKPGLRPSEWFVFTCEWRASVYDTASIQSSVCHCCPGPPTQPFLLSGILVFPGNINSSFRINEKIRKGLNLLSNVVYNFK